METRGQFHTLANLPPRNVCDPLYSLNRRVGGREPMLTFLLQYIYIYLLPYSMVQSPSWEANWFAASQEIPRISRNLKVLYCTHKRPPPVSILGQPNPVHISTSHLLQIYFRIYIYIYINRNKIQTYKILVRHRHQCKRILDWYISLNHFFSFQKMYASINFACTSSRLQ